MFSPNEMRSTQEAVPLTVRELWLMKDASRPQPIKRTVFPRSPHCSSLIEAARRLSLGSINTALKRLEGNSPNHTEDVTCEMPQCLSGLTFRQRSPSNRAFNWF